MVVLRRSFFPAPYDECWRYASLRKRVATRTGAKLFRASESEFKLYDLSKQCFELKGL